MRVGIFLCFFNQRYVFFFFFVIITIIGKEVTLVLGDALRQLVGRVHERELFRREEVLR